MSVSPLPPLARSPSLPDLEQSASGRGRVDVVAHHGRSRVTRAFATSPLRLLTPRNHGPAAWIFTSTFGGGLVGGDEFALGVDVGEGAITYLATQAATKVYRSELPATSALEATVAANGVLLVVPDPVVCFAGSSYAQVQRFQLHETANLVLVDWLSSGRHAAGERWRFNGYESRLTIARGGASVVRDAVVLSPDHGALAPRLGRFESLVTIVVMGPRFAHAADAMLARVAAMEILPGSSLLAGASAVAGGCIVRMAGTSVEATGAMMRRLLSFVPALLEDDPWARKW